MNRKKGCNERDKINKDWKNEQKEIPTERKT